MRGPGPLALSLSGEDPAPDGTDVVRRAVSVTPSDRTIAMTPSEFGRQPTASLRPSSYLARDSDASYCTHRDSLVFEPGCMIWSPCERDGFRRSTIVGVDESKDSFVVDAAEEIDSALATGGRELLVPRSEVRPFFDSGAGRTCDDSTALVHLDDANILDNLRRRFLADQVYTYCATVLLAVNPYKSMDHLYTDDKMREYRGKSIGSMPPHPYAIADEAYRHLVRERTDQALVISGESGAGKTETAKIMMHYLTRVSRTDAVHGGIIQDKIINATPILESFGNASTVRNRNSSRFGKYSEMRFNRVGTLVGAGIRTYLLESSRVVSQQDGEQNYRVFYEMLAGLEEERLDELLLATSERYQLLYSGNAMPLEEGCAEMGRHARHFAELRKALAVVGTSEDVEHGLWEIVAALIHLGEVGFMEITASSIEANAPADSSMGARSPCSQAASASSPDSAATQEPLVEVTGMDGLQQAADLLGLSAWRLKQVVQMKEMHVKKQSRRTSHIACPRSKAQATQTLQSFIKIVYQRLFDQIVERINASSGVGSKCGNSSEGSFNRIGTLDIYGFERLQTNSFEQLCINLANERLQQFFIEEVLSAELRMYQEEGLGVSILQLPDSTPVVSGVQTVMSILDEHSIRCARNLVRQGDDTDQRFCEHVHRELVQKERDKTSDGKPGPFMPLRLRANRNGLGPGMYDGFQVRHYAGDVIYSTRGWIDKNNDALVPEVEALLGSSSKQLVRSLSDSQTADALSGERFSSVSAKYLGNLNNLLATLSEGSVHYVRCFNPNTHRQPGVFDKKYVLDQVRQCGTVELVRIMHCGYPHRVYLQDLRDRFTSLLPADFAHFSNPDFVLAIMLAFRIDTNQWTLGTTRLFLKAGQLRTLESLRDCGSTASKAMIASIRKVFARKRMRKAFYAVCICLWLPRCLKEARLERMAQKLRKVVYVYVRLHRWLRAARTRLYCDEDGDATGSSVKDLELGRLGREMRRLGLAQRGPKPAARPRPGAARLFAAREPLAAGAAEHGSESLLYFDGCSVFNTRLRDSSSGALWDVRQVDAQGSSCAYPVWQSRWQGDLVLMCQHRHNPDLFATCDARYQVLVWEWQGVTASEEPGHVPVLPWGALQIPLRSEQAVVQMCFLPARPRHVAERDGEVLVVASVEKDRMRLELMAIAVYEGHHSEMLKLVVAELPKNMWDAGLEVRFLETSVSGRVLALGGQGLLHFYEVGEDTGGQLTLALVEDMSRTFPDLGHDTMMSCLSLPPPVKSGGIMDWVVVGGANGDLYGFRLDATRSGGAVHVNHETSGRFRTNTHDVGVPVSAVVAQLKGVGGLASQDERRFFSIGANGRILTWSLLEESGWSSTGHDSLYADISRVPSGSGRFVAACASRLAPRLLVTADEEHGVFVCYDTTKANETRLCSYV